MNSNTLKKYQTQLKKLKSKQDVVGAELEDCQQRYNQIKAEILETQTKINELSRNNQLIVSEHATIRVLERVFEVNLDEINQQIIDDVLPIYTKLGDGIILVKCIDMRAVIKNGVIDESKKNNNNVIRLALVNDKKELKKCHYQREVASIISTSAVQAVKELDDLLG
ncbi:hypothetical protein [Gilliamella sp. G0441]|uniref:hypothetical protein n=1 Tax=Gilliamella sp. G0441 TaxID=3384760 RepID=UPI003D336EE8